MSAWTVHWLSQAEDDLADLWLHASDRPAVTAAQDQLEQLLQRDPLGHGSELGEGLWKITVDPLKAYYTVEEPARRVTVTNVALSS